VSHISLVLGIPHIPFFHRRTLAPREEWPEDLLRQSELNAMVEKRLEQAAPDVLVVVASDHFHQFFMDNMPAFLIAKRDRYDGIFANETREFLLPPCTVPGDAALSGRLAHAMMARGVDLSFSNDLKLDHATVVPLMMVAPRLDVAVVPILTNCGAPPMPTPRRFFELGVVLRSALDEVAPDRTVAVITSGNLSLEVGGPLQFAPVPSDEAFDDRATELLRRGDHEALVEECRPDRLRDTGNTTGQFLNFLTALGIAEGHMTCTYAEAMKRKGSSQPYFIWEPRADAPAALAPPNSHGSGT
jgi:protocatechuate 4,5-dioxygenase, beta chain